MFGLFKKEEFICLGVNPDSDWSNMDTFMAPLKLFQDVLMKSTYTNEQLKELQKKLDEYNLGYKDILKEFNWVSLSKSKKSLESIEFVLQLLISGVRPEFETSEAHIELYEKHITPSIVKSLSSESTFLKANVKDVEDEFFEKGGVIFPLHFDSVLVRINKYKDVKTGKIFRNVVIEKEVERRSLEPNSFGKLNIIIKNILAKLDDGELSIIDEENEMLEILAKNEELRDKYLEIKAYFILGISNLKIGQIEKAKKFFDTILNLETTISRNTIASDFIRPIGDYYEKNDDLTAALFWYKKAIEFSPAIGLKKKIKEMEEKINN
jgi:tetratricopeptide (TPR) repeat protein